MYFTDGSLLPYERMMKLAPKGRCVTAPSSSNMPLWQLEDAVKNQENITEVSKNEHGQ